MPHQPFLLPGYGAQGGGAEGVQAATDASGGGVLVTASRSIIYPDEAPELSWTDAIQVAAEGFALEVRGALEFLLLWGHLLWEVNACASTTEAFVAERLTKVGGGEVGVPAITKLIDVVQNGA